jgi:hypothetical protein
MIAHYNHTKNRLKSLVGKKSLQATPLPPLTQDELAKRVADKLNTSKAGVLRTWNGFLENTEYEAVCEYKNLTEEVYKLGRELKQKIKADKKNISAKPIKKSREKHPWKK